VIQTLHLKQEELILVTIMLTKEERLERQEIIVNIISILRG